MQIHYLEIVTPDVGSFCETHQRQNGTTFGDPQELLGNARVAELENGGRIGVRAPMHDAEEAVTRPYFLVQNIETETEAAVASGAELMVPPTEIPGIGRFSIFALSGIQQGFWQV